MSPAAGTAPSAASRHHRIFLPVLAALITLAWITLWAWARSPYGRYLEHGDWTASGPAAFLCRVVPAGEVVVPMALYATAWILMTAAMMLPTTLPLFNVFDRLTQDRPDHGRLLMLLGLGYMAVWGAFGLAAHALHGAVLALLAGIPALAWHGWLIGAAVIALAGAFQFSRLKYQCLDKCRTPLSFVIQHWRGHAHGRHAFALGTGSLGWMLLLAAVMAIEKNVRWGRRLSAPLGFALLGWALVMVAAHA